MITLEFPTLTEHRAEWGLCAGYSYIYGLYDPRDNELRYIGKSVRPAERFSNQLNERANTHRCHWIQELRRLGLVPIQRIIDTVQPGTDWQTIERRYIAGARAAGYRLVNGTDGGDGVEGLGEESRAKMRATWLGRKHSEESRAKMSAAQRGHVATTETRQRMSARQSGRQITWRIELRDAVQKLNADQVREIRALLRERVSQYVIAARYGVHQGTISNIARGKSYAHISDGAA